MQHNICISLFLEDELKYCFSIVSNRGTKFQLKVKNLDIEKWEQQLKEGKTYIAQNFEVESNKEDYKTTKHGYKLVFVKGTMLKEQDLPDIPHYGYDFTKFETIINKNVVADVLIGK